ncbi:MAG: four helix bundle protein [Candidatus Paceibacterota bacterium]
MIKTFKDLIVWQKSMYLVEVIYKLTDDLPQKEQFSLTSQMRRAAVSIPSCIAEGSKRNSRRDYAHFLVMSQGSSMELETQLLLVQKIYKLEVEESLKLLEEVQKMLSVMINKLKPTT